MADKSDKTATSLDPPTPSDWSAMRALGHQMLDDMFDYLQRRSSDDAEQVWQPMPAEVRSAFQTASLPELPTELPSVYKEFRTSVMPYVVGNTHPGFMGWVHGGGTPVGMLTEMLAGGLNANCGGRDHSAIEVEKQISRWLAEIFGFPENASGLFVTGTSMANFLAVLIARHQALGSSVRTIGLAAEDAGKLVAYASEAAHTCIVRAMEYAGLGSQALRRIRISDSDHRMDLDALQQAIESDLALGLRPFLIIGTAGSVGIGAVDDLNALSEIAASHGAWFHVDGAFGALGILNKDFVAPRLSGIQRAHSIALDFHKWGQVQYDAGFVLVRDATAHRETFATEADYLSRSSRGLQKGDVWPNDLGPDLSRGFRALKTWFTLKVYGTQRLGEIIGHTCEVAQYLAQKIEDEAAELELMAPVQLNIVCFRYRHAGPDVDSINADIVMDVQESGLAAPSTLKIKGSFVIRAAIFNHRTAEKDVDKLVSAVLKFGRKRVSGR